MGLKVAPDTTTPKETTTDKAQQQKTLVQRVDGMEWVT
jgi:hypothetical protein